MKKSFFKVYNKNETKLKLSKDTIVAIATPRANSGGIGIIRVSGEKAFSFAIQLFRPKQKFKQKIQSHKFYFGHIIDKKKVVDEVFFVYMKSPKSYTAEDVVEIHSHSNPIILEKIVSLFILKGARLAQNGEFTKRAFLNGRIDLTQAEAVIDIIKAKNEKALEVATKQSAGDIRVKIEKLKNSLFKILARFEIAIDFPEDVEDEIDFDELKKDIEEKLILVIQKALEEYKTFSFFKKGINISIIGEVNVGKSSLLNALLEKEKAIVTDIAGTTRDLIEDVFMVKELHCTIVDTAGITETENIVEKIGIEKAKESIKKSDLILFVIDSSLKQPVKDYFFDLFLNKKVLFIFNKIDKITEKDSRLLSVKGFPFLKISVLKKEGIEKVKDTIFNMFKEKSLDNDFLIINNVRQKISMEEALKNILSLKKNIEKINIPFEIISLDIKKAIYNLNEILGENIEEEVLDRVFQDFCIGK